MIRIWQGTIALFLAVSVNALAQDRFTSRLTTQTGQTLVVAEGDFEARSVGSFSVRLYDTAAAPDETTFFIAGLIRARDGVVETVILADIDGDKKQEVIVIVRSVGTGSYQSAYAFAIANDALALLSAEENLAANADPVAVLQKTMSKQE